MQFSTLFLALSALVISSNRVDAAPRGCRHHSVHTVTKWYNAPTNVAAVEVSSAFGTDANSNSTATIVEPTPTAVEVDTAAPTAVVTDSASDPVESSAPEESSAATSSELSSSSEGSDYEDTTSAAEVPTSTATSTAASVAPSASASASGGASADSSDVKSMVQLHNDFRAQYGAGSVTWSDELASYASSHATACNMEHTHGPYGENLAAGVGGGYSIADAFQAWADEAPEYDPSNPQYSHFTQVVWKGTTEIGCAAVSCPSGSIFDMAGDSLYVMCEYNPPGNVIGQFAENVGSKTA
ncbi:hypothetical protein I316_01059 [Kwoniella heveanensis BCC8398]|uniref:SCP domain-containing protein n=1 Tax=Kwoniella heveanensis BCC8398 TaxID=1296120 RepID=A0A1B9H1K4_9TREE|nr:hypothetical protein I316_01059 [Kwoniella heveanensis BCC8398]